MKLIITILGVVIGAILGGPIGGIIGFFVGAWGYNIVFIKGKIHQAGKNVVDQRITFINDVMNHAKEQTFSHLIVMSMFENPKYSATLLSNSALACPGPQYGNLHVIAAYTKIREILNEETRNFAKGNY